MNELQELLEKQLNESNFLIEGSGDYTVIYFSSLGIIPDNAELFKRNIIKNNSFEFYKTRINKNCKHIFVRDVNRSWYLKGINKTINTYEKLAEFLKKESKGTKIITIGSSAGGFAAVLFGILLNAVYVFSFNGQIEVKTENVKFNLSDYVKNSDIPIFYMLSVNFEEDVVQLERIKNNENVFVLSIKSNIHGVPVFSDALKKIINSDIDALKKLYSHKDNPIKERIFVLKHFGLYAFLCRMIKKNFYNIIKRKNK